MDQIVAASTQCGKQSCPGFMQTILSVALFLALGATIAFTQATMTIRLSGKHIVSTDTQVIEVVDKNCNRNLGQFSLKGNQVIPISICKDDAGYGNIQYRNVTNNGSWTGSSLLKDGEEVSP